MKKIIPLIIVALLVTGLYGARYRGARAMSSIGVGFGIPYGMIGFMLEVDPVYYLGLCAGFGYAIEGAGYSFGIRIYPLGVRARLPFFFSGYYGVVGYVEDVKTFTGGAFGFGLRQPIRGRRMSVSFEVLFLSFEKEPWYSYGSNVKVAAGLQWRL